MAKSKKESMRDWVNTWKETGKLLEKIRGDEILNSKIEDTILALDDAFHSALFLSPNKKTSGLIEFHKILSKSR